MEASQVLAKPNSVMHLECNDDVNNRVDRKSLSGLSTFEKLSKQDTMMSSDQTSPTQSHVPLFGAKVNWIMKRSEDGQHQFVLRLLTKTESLGRQLKINTSSYITWPWIIWKKQLCFPLAQRFVLAVVPFFYQELIETKKGDWTCCSVWTRSSTRSTQVIICRGCVFTPQVVWRKSIRVVS